MKDIILDLKLSQVLETLNNLSQTKEYWEDDITMTESLCEIPHYVKTIYDMVEYIENMTNYCIEYMED